MRTPYRSPMLIALLALVVGGIGCNLVKAKAAFKKGNKLYEQESFRDAIVEYEQAVALKPDFAEAHAYLASAHQSLFRPGQEGEENRMHLDKAIQHYETSLEVNQRETPNQEAVRLTALSSLTGIYSDPPVEDFEKALRWAEELVKDDPDDMKNMYGIANLYEKFERVDDAEATYVRVVENNPDDPKACGALSAFYNKALWDREGNVWTDDEQGPRRSRFEDTIEVMEDCAKLDPNDAGGYYKVAVFYWNKAYRDPDIDDTEKNQYADLGIEAVDKALGIQPDYWEAIISKGLLFRVKAQVAPNRTDRRTFLEQAQLLQKQALDLRQERQAADAAADVPPEALAES